MPPVILATISLDAMAGGLEKNIILLSNYLSDQEFDVHLVTFDRADADSFYTIDNKVQWHKVGVGRPHAEIAFWDRVKLILRIRSIVSEIKLVHKRPVILCFHHGILTRFFLAAFFLGVRIVCSERNSLSLYDHFSQRKWNLNFILLSFVRKIVVQFPEYAQDYPFWMRKCIVHIPNPVMGANTTAQPGLPGSNNRFILLTVGRLCAQKQQDILIDAFSTLAHQYQNWDLVVVGEGDLRPKLEKMIADRSLHNRVFLVGNSEQVHKWMERAHLFCLPSQWEGFPNALAEALAHGLPAVGFSACAGVNMLIKSGANGLLVSGANDPEALALGLKELISSPQCRSDMGLAGIKSVSTYTPNRVFKRWSRLFSEIAGVGTG